jgi:hypothetical protein
MNRLPALLCCAVWAAALAGQPAQAHVWVYVDGSGVGHVASSQLDSRYRMLLGDEAGKRNQVLGKADGPSRLVTWLGFAPEVKRLQPLLREAAQLYGVDIELLKAVITVESGFDEKAVSPRGAIGLMQITPDTAERYASPAQDVDRPAPQRLLDARTNIFTGARMLSDLLRRFGSIDVALAAWNAGEGKVRQAGGKMPPIAETQAHVQLVLELYWALLQDKAALGARQFKLLSPPAASGAAPQDKR